MTLNVIVYVTALVIVIVIVIVLVIVLVRVAQIVAAGLQENGERMRKFTL